MTKSKTNTSTGSKVNKNEPSLLINLYLFAYNGGQVVG